jgi:hypothetical protein
MFTTEQLVITVVIIVLGFFGLVFLVEWIIDVWKTKKLLKHPEIVRARVEAEKARIELEKKKRFEAPVLIPKKVDVYVVREGEQFLHDTCKYDGELLNCRGIQMMLTVPEGYRPYVQLDKGKKIKVVFFFNEHGEAIKWNLAEMKPLNIAPDPRISNAVLNRRFLQQVFRMFWGLDTASLFAGIGLGVFVIFFVIFFVLPIMGYPVTIGKIPVEIKIGQTTPSSLPPPGNYTVPTG